ncbi:uncharacterized protein LOC119368575 isoform X1 [Triticum dicoccoides]|uniref:uncharacterized protein LOC119368575 isoform X1 n=1 Tax=Triticum dicoccoides TaxID=85692 RepID=UPI00188DCA7E|nr:uncharacterized protein LOC119368575 isoform X1 [Triticum dicoccoides]
MGPVRSERAGRPTESLYDTAGWRVRRLGAGRPLSRPTSSTGSLFRFGGKTTPSRRQWCAPMVVQALLVAISVAAAPALEFGVDRRRRPTIQQRAWGLPFRPVAAASIVGSPDSPGGPGQRQIGNTPDVQSASASCTTLSSGGGGWPSADAGAGAHSSGAPALSHDGPGSSLGAAATCNGGVAGHKKSCSNPVLLFCISSSSHLSCVFVSLFDPEGCICTGLFAFNWDSKDLCLSSPGCMGVLRVEFFIQ